MNYLTYLQQLTTEPSNPLASLNFLVSGEDPIVRDKLLCELIAFSRKNNRKILIVNDSNAYINMSYLKRFGYEIHEGFSGFSTPYNPLDISSLSSQSRLRQILDLMGYNEYQKQKLIAYLHFISHMENYNYNTRPIPLTIDTLASYCTVMQVEEKIQQLYMNGYITEPQKIYFLAKYSELSSTAADFEHTLLHLTSLMSDDSPTNASASSAHVLNLFNYHNDLVIKRVLLQLTLYSLQDMMANVTVVILDSGVGNRTYLTDFLQSPFPNSVSLHCFSNDIFTAEDPAILSSIFNKFNTHVYSRHISMDSCRYIEANLGDIDVLRSSTAVTTDRRSRSNSTWDILFGRNKTETITQNPLIREPRFRKELISTFSHGDAILSYGGNASIFKF